VDENRTRQIEKQNPIDRASTGLKPVNAEVLREYAPPTLGRPGCFPRGLFVLKLNSVLLA
jgi:hypothetical protein